MFSYEFNKLCDPTRLTAEIVSAGITEIISCIDTWDNPSKTIIKFDQRLITDDVIKLTNVVDRHSKILLDNVLIDTQEKDFDGAIVTRVKAAKKGWNFWAIPIEITTASLDALFCKMSDGTDIPWVECAIYDEADQQITNPENASQCVKTVIDFEPNFDYEIIGGALRVNSNITQDVRLWIVGAPDIPQQYGGSKEFASGINLKFLAPDNSFEIDGRVAKFLSYNPTTHQSKMRIILKHPAGVQINVQLVIHMYRA